MTHDAISDAEAERFPTRTHGLRGTYARGCRCRPCVVADCAYTYDLRRRRAAALAIDPTIREHGTPTTYTAWACRCDVCVASYSTYQHARRRRALATP